jgi:hypothetical protein
MGNDESDARITAQMKDVIVHLEDQDLVRAEENMLILAQEVQMVADEPVRERKLANLRKHLHSGLGHVRRATPFTALIRFRAALTSWLTAIGWKQHGQNKFLISELRETQETFALLSSAIQESDSPTAQQLLKDAKAAYEAAHNAVLEYDARNREVTLPEGT